MQLVVILAIGALLQARVFAERGLQVLRFPLVARREISQIQCPVLSGAHLIKPQRPWTTLPLA
eukprot:6092265-Alexandrium_andersonii.AAC.1